MLLRKVQAKREEMSVKTCHHEKCGVYIIFLLTISDVLKKCGEEPPNGKNYGQTETLRVKTDTSK